MIIEWLLGLVAGLMEWLVSILPVWDPPAWLTDQHSLFMDTIEGFTGLGVWVDWTAVGICVPAALIAFLVTLTVRLVRVIAGYIPGWAGSGA